MPRRICAISGKGGAGKTTVIILVAGEYAIQGKKVLLIDADPRQNLAEWWKRCEAKDNLPANIELHSAATQRSIETVLAEQNDVYDVILMDSPGVDSVIRDTIIRNSHLVLTPIQPNQDEIKAAGEAATVTADIGDREGRTIPHVNVVTRIALPGRVLEAYRLIRPFIANLRDNGYESTLMDTELTERNCYREIRNGLGTLQMLELTDPVMKGRAEIAAFVAELDRHLAANPEKVGNV
ncbi:MAG: ParA family protein [Mesorhizobium sp.]|uniref:ParA family protein n=1 Tax=Mesorhizobium sp. TaxID=1871066 RepID=UPI0011FAEC6B|nr:ParA family protein [Mesorhizobium sp.]TIR29936.1 MAG: ParA family protein [Mesorhizobium sp.]